MILLGDAFEMLATLESESVQCCITSPPYWGLRDYGVDGQLGLEKTPEEYINNMRIVFEQVKRVLKTDGTAWVNLGDSYGGNGGQYGDKKSTIAGRKQSLSMGAKRFRKKIGAKQLLGIPWRIALALQSDGFYLRQDIIWHKPNPMPESVRDRCTKAHEYIFLLSKSKKYYFDNDAIREPIAKSSLERIVRGSNGSLRAHAGKRKNGPMKPVLVGSHGRTGHDGKGMRMLEKWNNPNGRSKRSVWTVSTKPFKMAHFATFPPDLIEPCVLAGTKPGDTILDPFFGSGTVGLVAKKHGREFIGIELNPSYIEIAKKRLEGTHDHY